MASEDFSRDEVEELVSLPWPWCEVEAPMDRAKRGRIFKAGCPPAGTENRKTDGGAVQIV